MGIMQNIRMLQAPVPVRHEMFEGRRRLVVPVIALVEGVHHGSHGPLFYPAGEIGKYVGAWNGIPLPVFHPDEQGKAVSANSPRVIEERSVGNLFNVYFEEDGGKLRGELWIDEDKARKISPEILSIILSGRQLDVSTGLWSDDDGTPGMWNDEEYFATVMNFRPDHLALLPGGAGACSWADGCGVRANQPGIGGDDMDLEVNVKATARTPSFDGTESVSWAEVDASFGAYRDAYYRGHGGRPDDVPSRVQDAPIAMRRWIASKTLLGDETADNERDLTFFPVVNPGTGKLNEGALRAVLGGRAAQARIPAGAKVSAQAKARDLLNGHFDAELETDAAGNQKGELGRLKKVFDGIQNVLSGLGFRVQEMSHEDLRSKLQHALDAMDNPGWIHFIQEVFDDTVVYQARGNNPSEAGIGGTVKLYQRGFSVDENGEVKLKDDTKEVRQETRYVPVDNSARRDGANKPTKEVRAMEKTKIVDALIACEATRFAEKDRDWLMSLEEDRLATLGIVDAKPKEPAPQTNEPAKPPAKEAGDQKPPVVNKPPTVDEYIANAPPEIQGVLRRSVARDQQIKADLVKSLMANPRNSFTEEELGAKDIGDLERLAALAQIEVDYSGQVGGPAANKADKIPAMPPSYVPAAAK